MSFFAKANVWSKSFSSSWKVDKYSWIVCFTKTSILRMESSIVFKLTKTMIILFDFTVRCQLFPRIKLLEFSHYIIYKPWYFASDSIEGGTSGLT